MDSADCECISAQLVNKCETTPKSHSHNKAGICSSAAALTSSTIPAPAFDAERPYSKRPNYFVSIPISNDLVSFHILMSSPGLIQIFLRCKKIAMMTSLLSLI